MSSTGATTTPTQIVDTYHAIESRATQAIRTLQERGGKPNIAVAAKGFFVPKQRLGRRWNGRRSKQQPPGNRKWGENQELAVCQYLDRLNTIGLPAHLFMITDCANAILRAAMTAMESDVHDK